jgi:hypothetical protein
MSWTVRSDGCAAMGLFGTLNGGDRRAIATGGATKNSSSASAHLLGYPSPSEWEVVVMRVVCA